MADDPIQGVIETIDTANKHRLHLSELLSQLEAAKSQVRKNYSQNSKMNKLDHSDVVGASPVGAVPTTSLFST